MSKQVSQLFLLLIIFNLKCYYALSDLGIIGGHDAVRGQFPYVVSIQILCSAGPCLPDCGGTIINSEWILTAATCTDSVDAIDRVVVAGLFNVSDIDANAQVAGVDEYIIHPYFDKKSVIPQDNLALWKLNTSLVFNEFVQPVQLPVYGPEPTGMATLSGWGKSGNTRSQFPDILQTLDVPIVSFEDCAKALSEFPDLSREFVLRKNLNICTGLASDDSSACHGDNGGPLTQNGTLVGVVSKTFSPCGRVKFPDVYARVFSYLAWIKMHISY